MIQITEFPIKKSIYYEITTVLMAMNRGFHDTFSADHKSFVSRTKTQALALWHDVILRILARIKKLHLHLIHTCKKSWEGPIDPSSYNYHWQDICYITLHHICHHCWICKVNNAQKCNICIFKGLIPARYTFACFSDNCPFSLWIYVFQFTLTIIILYYENGKLTSIYLSKYKVLCINVTTYILIGIGKMWQLAYLYLCLTTIRIFYILLKYFIFYC